MTGGLKMGVNVAAHTRHIFLESAPPPRVKSSWKYKWVISQYHFNYTNHRWVVEVKSYIIGKLSGEQIFIVLSCFEDWFKFLSRIMEICTSNQNWGCFVRYLKMINIFGLNNSILKQIVWETQNGSKILADQAVIELLIKTTCIFWSTTHEPPLGPLKS